jgi:capsular exopolysaccharide synthesis family protein
MSDNKNNNPFLPQKNNSSNGFNNGYNGDYHSGELRAQGSSAPGDELDLKYLFQAVLRYKWWALTITLIFVIGAGYYAYSLPAEYQSSGTILIQEERNRYTWADSDLSSILTSSFGVGSGSRLVNEIEVLKSRMIAEEIADKVIDKYLMDDGNRFPVLYTDYPQDTTMATRGAVASKIRTAMQVNRIDNETDILTITYKSPSPYEASELTNITMDTYTEVSARQKRTAATEALRFLEQELEDSGQNLESSEEALKEYMTRTSIVQVDGQTEAAINRLAELESQLQQVQVQRVSVNSSIEAYEDQLDQIRPGLAEQFADNISSTMERTQYRLAEREAERLLMLQRNPSLRNNPEAEPQLVQLEDEIQTLKQQINSMAADLIGEESEQFLGFLNQGDGGITGRIIQLRSNLIELRIEQSQMDAQEEVLVSRIADENQFLDNLPENMIELARLQRDAQVNEQLYSVISEQFTQTQLWEQTQYGSGRILDTATVPGTPSGPNRIMIILIGFMLGGALSVGFVFSKEMLNRRVDGTEKLTDTGYPVLALIPDNGKQIQKRFEGKDSVDVDGRNVSTSWTMLLDAISPVSESYRRLHNNIIYADPDQDCKTIIVTSSKMGEGKSTVSVNLAVALAESGKKVLIIDTDLRRPSLHKITGEAREPGLVEIFYDDRPLSIAVKSTAAPGVHMITSGRSIANPSAVLQSKKMKHLLEKMKEKYDHIILDTPPYGVITDAATMMRLGDGVVLVTRFGYTEMNELYHTIENLKRINANVVGTLINCYEHSKSSDYYYKDYTYDSYYAYEEYQEKA